jgi:acetyl-CoA C-acetyltransferase
MSAHIIGVGKTRFGPTSKTMPQLAQEAIIEALCDARLDPEDLDAVVVGNFLGGPNEHQLHLNSVIAGLFPGLNLPSWRTEAACASGGVAIHQAILALGHYETVLVVGIERMSSVVGNEVTRNIGMAG